MNSNYLKSRIGSAVLGISLLFGIGMASSVTVQAQWQNDRYEREQQRRYEREQRRRQREYEREQLRRQRQAQRQAGYGNYGGYGNSGYYGNGGYGNYGGSYEMRQTALNAGYNEGVRRGREDRSRGDRYDYSDEGSYQSADKDYNSRYGDRNLYRQYYRQGFVNGYTDGYRGY